MMVAGMSVMAVIMVFLVHKLAEAAVEYDVRNNLRKEIEICLKKIMADKSEAEQNEAWKSFIPEEYDAGESAITFLILDADGGVLRGAYPDGFYPDTVLQPRNRLTRTVGSGRDTRFVRDMRIGSHGDGETYLRGVVRKADVPGQYSTMESTAYMGVFGIWLLLLVGGILFSKKISADMEEMCETADEIGRGGNVSGRMLYDGRFRELSVLAEANNRMLDRMEQTILWQEQFASDAAHELRTPVTVILAQCEYVEEAYDNREELEMAFDVIHRQAGKMNATIAEMIQLSRIDRNRGMLQPEDVELSEIASALCEDAAGEKDIRFVLRLQEKHVPGDVGLITIALQNILNNAIKFSSEGGRIEVRTGTCAEGAFFLVRDYGIGMTEDEADHIFERFYKADKSRNSVGIGLGLSITQKIVELHEGSIEVRSSRGKGSTFIVRFPEKKSEKREEKGK